MQSTHYYHKLIPDFFRETILLMYASLAVILALNPEISEFMKVLKGWAPLTFPLAALLGFAGLLSIVTTLRPHPVPIGMDRFLVRIGATLYVIAGTVTATVAFFTLPQENTPIAILQTFIALLYLFQNLLSVFFFLEEDFTVRFEDKFLHDKPRYLLLAAELGIALMVPLIGLHIFNYAWPMNICFSLLVTVNAHNLLSSHRKPQGAHTHY